MICHGKKNVWYQDRVKPPPKTGPATSDRTKNEIKSTIDNTGGVIVVVITEHIMKVNKSKGLIRLETREGRDGED